MGCGKVRIHGKWRHLTPEEEMKLAMERVDWIPREKCLGCYQLAKINLEKHLTDSK